MPRTEDYSTRLRAEALQELSPRIESLKEELRAFKNNFAESLGQFEEKVHALGSLELAAGENILTEAVDCAVQQKDQEIALLANFIVEIQQKETQEEILGLLLDRAHEYSQRLALFIVRPALLSGWSSRGFSEKVADKIPSSAVAQEESPALKSVLEIGSRAAITEISAESALQRLFEEEAPGPWHVFPMKVMQRPIALLLAANAENKGNHADLLALMCAITQLCIENIALRIMEEMRDQYPADEQALPAVPAQEAPEPEHLKAAELPAETAVAPDLSAGQAAMPAEAVEVAASPAEDEGTPRPEAMEIAIPQTFSEAIAETPVAAPIEEPVAARAAEEEAQSPAMEQPLDDFAETAFKEQAEPPQEFTATSPGAAEKAPPISDEAKSHADAKRFARLLVSEIKLYNEQRVLDGRRNRDIYVRLKRDIDRSREMYTKRVAPSVAQKVDYFHDEILRILGDNDPSTLGSDYPGPLIEN
jgi:hypothetical protein